MAPKVNTYVHLVDPDTNARVVLAPGDEVPKNLKDAVGAHALESTDEAEVVVIPAAGPGQSALDADTLRQIREAREAEAARAKAEAKEAADKEAAENEAKRLKAEAEAAAEQEKIAKANADGNGDGQAATAPAAPAPSRRRSGS